jgi:hypothetical protein
VFHSQNEGVKPFFLAVLSLACGAPADPIADAPVEQAPASCEVLLSPSPELLGMAQSAAEQWSAAVSCNVRIGEGGIPMALVPRVLNAKGEPQCGVTHRLRDEAGAVVGVSSIEISASKPDRCWQTARHVLHETGHAIVPQLGHAKLGLMAAAPDGTDWVDPAAVAFVSAGLPH